MPNESTTDTNGSTPAPPKSPALTQHTQHTQRPSRVAGLTLHTGRLTCTLRASRQGQEVEVDAYWREIAAHAWAKDAALGRTQHAAPDTEAKPF
jgi:hypothetical protein